MSGQHPPPPWGNSSFDFRFGDIPSPELKEGLRRWDPLYNRFLEIIEEERRRSPYLAAASEGFKISPLQCEAIRLDGSLQPGLCYGQNIANFTLPIHQVRISGIGRYYEDCRFNDYRLHFPKVGSCIVTVRSGPIDDRLELEIAQERATQWCSVRDWWRMIALQCNFNDVRQPQGGYGIWLWELEKMWKLSGKTFPLMELPREIRDKIFRFLVGPQIWPHLTCRCCSLQGLQGTTHSDYELSLEGETNDGQCLGGIHPIGFEAPRAPVIQAPKLWGIGMNIVPEDSHANIGPGNFEALSAMGLMRAGKDVRQQMEELIWSSPTVKRFNRRFVLAHVLTFFQVHPLRLRRARLNLTSPTQYPGCLSHVKLSFTNEEYFRFIGYESTHGIGFARNQILPHVRLETLTAVPTLKHLELQFQVLSPNIVSVEGFRGYAYDPWHNIRPEAETEVSCQKEWLRIFLTLAYSRLRSVDKVTLSGHVKNSTREYWEPKLSGEVHDMKHAREEVLSTPAWDLPPACACSPPCAWWNVPYDTNNETSNSLQEFSVVG